MNTGEISSKIRNIFQPAELVKRNDDGSVQIKTAYSRTVDNLEEAFPYGLKSKEKKEMSPSFVRAEILTQSESFLSKA